MPYRIAETALNASTIDILNVIRSNATYEYQSLIPEVDSADMVPRVGEVLYGHPALANQFLNALVNRIALVLVKSATFNNKYARLKKGYLEFGETVEDVFVQIAKARIDDPEKAHARELKRTLPDVKSAFHTMNWKVQYPVTIQNNELKQAFTSLNGVESLIARIIDSVYTAVEYDEYLLFKYMLIKAASHGKMIPVAFDASDPKKAAIAFRGKSNRLTLMNRMNEAGVDNATPKEKQHIFMDADFNAQYDVEVLASAFNMDKATFSGNLELIDDWTTFDNERFAAIRAESDMIEEVTEAELAVMKNVKAVLVDSDWFQIYDNLTQFTETYVSSGMYWNYFLHVWKTVSHSPFASALLFVDDAQSTDLPDVINGEITIKSAAENGTVLGIGIDQDNPVVAEVPIKFMQTQAAVEKTIGVQPYGAILYPANGAALEVHVMIGGIEYVSVSRGGTSPNYTYTKTTVATTAKVGDTVYFKKASTL